MAARKRPAVAAPALPGLFDHLEPVGRVAPDAARPAEPTATTPAPEVTPDAAPPPTDASPATAATPVVQAAPEPHPVATPEPGVARSPAAWVMGAPVELAVPSRPWVPEPPPPRVPLPPPVPRPELPPHPQVEELIADAEPEGKDAVLAALWREVWEALGALRALGRAVETVAARELLVRSLARALETRGGGANCGTLAEDWIRRAREHREALLEARAS